MKPRDARNYARRTNGRQKRVTLEELAIDRGELLLPVQIATGLHELHYNAERDTIYWKPTGKSIERRKLLVYFRKWLRRHHGYGQGSELYLGPVILRTPYLRPLLQACALYRRQLSANRITAGKDTPQPAHR